MTQSSPMVRVKGVGDSLWVSFDSTQSREVLLQEFERVFRQAKNLAANARIILDPGDNLLSDELVAALSSFLLDEFKVGSVRLSAQDESENRKLSKLTNREEKGQQGKVDLSLYNSHSEVHFLTGKIRSGQQISARKHLILLGDVNPGAEVYAGGDVLIMGHLRGKVVAGYPDSETAIVLALDFRPIQVQIGTYVAAGSSESSSGLAEIAYVVDGTIVVDQYLQTDPFGHLPGLKKR